MRHKVTVVGEGTVAAICAQRLAERDYADVVHDAADMAGSDVVVLAGDSAGRARVAAVAAAVRDHAPDAIAGVAGEPLHETCRVVYDATYFPRDRVLGVGPCAAAARFRGLVAAELAVSSRDVDALVLGGASGDPVPLASCTSVAGIPLRRLLARDRVDALVRASRATAADAGAIASGAGAVAAAVDAMVDAIVHDQHRLMACAVLCRGEYGIDGEFAGVPATVGRGGVEKVVRLDLEPDEQALLFG